MKKFIDWIKPFLVALVIAVIINSFIIVNAVIPTSSMEPTIDIGDRLIAFRLSYVFSEPKRGDIIIFDSNHEDKLLVKRIIGLPGDIIEIKDKVLLINDVAYDETYIKAEIIGNFGPYQVPNDKYFVLGDNRNSSRDSRFWEDPYIGKSLIKGKALLKYFPSFKFMGGQNG